MNLTKLQRKKLFDKYHGCCACCGFCLSEGWHADHIEPIVRDFKYDSDKNKFVNESSCRKPENKNFENLNPSCPSCNRMKSSLSLESFRELIQGFPNSLKSYSTQYKFADKYGLVIQVNQKVIFHFEKFQTQ